MKQTFRLGITTETMFFYHFGSNFLYCTVPFQNKAQLTNDRKLIRMMTLFVMLNQFVIGT